MSKACSTNQKKRINSDTQNFWKFLTIYNLQNVTWLNQTQLKFFIYWQSPFAFPFKTCLFNLSISNTYVLALWFIDKVLLLFHLKHAFSTYPFQIRMYLLCGVLHMEITGYRNMKIAIFDVFCIKADFRKLSYQYLWIKTKHFPAAKSSDTYFASKSWTNMIPSL